MSDVEIYITCDGCEKWFNDRQNCPCKEAKQEVYCGRCDKYLELGKADTTFNLETGKFENTPRYEPGLRINCECGKNFRPHTSYGLKNPEAVEKIKRLEKEMKTRGEKIQLEVGQTIVYLKQ